VSSLHRFDCSESDDVADRSVIGGLVVAVGSRSDSFCSYDGISGGGERGENCFELG
jgi:hypothetical protein